MQIAKDDHLLLKVDDHLLLNSQGAKFQKQPFGQPRFLMGKLYIFGILRHSTLWKPES